MGTSTDRSAEMNNKPAASTPAGGRRLLYFDCGMGAAGDMLAAALFELLDDEKKKAFLDTMRALAPEGVEISMDPMTKCGILGTHFDVVIGGEREESADFDGHAHAHIHEHAHHHEHEHEHEHPHCHEHEHHHDHHHDHGHAHHHYGMADIEAIINGFDTLSEEVRGNILDVYKIIASAESAVHGTDVSEIHFHEVGTMDAVIDVTAVCVLMDMLAPDEVCASPVRTGKGHVRCAHGILPVPAPATARILMGIPAYAGGIEAELCTPTGAALLRHFAGTFGDQPVMAVTGIGYGMGTKDFEVCNCLRAMIGE